MKLLTTTILVFSGVLAIMVGLRLDQQTMAILTGTAIGFVVAAVCIGIVAYIVLNRKPMPKTEHEPAIQTETRPQQYAHPTMQYTQNYAPQPMLEYQTRSRGPMGPSLPYQPVVYGYVDPRMAQFAQPPTYMGQTPYPQPAQYMQPMPMQTPRRFTMIGAGGQAEEIMPSQDELQPIYDM